MKDLNINWQMVTALFIKYGGLTKAQKAIGCDYYTLQKLNNGTHKEPSRLTTAIKILDHLYDITPSNDFYKVLR